MERREFLKAAALTAAACLVPGELFAAAGNAAADKARKPNIIFILSDDVGLGDIGCFGSDHYKTPKIDALAKSGIKFTQCYAEPLCGPSRCEIMTGRYAFRTGMISNASGPVILPANETMMPKVLKTAGYVTAQVGKWSQLPLQPSNWGFDEYLRFPGSGQYWSKSSPNYTENGQIKPLGDKYLPDVMHDFLVDFITRHKSEPFYVHYAMSHIHGKIVRTPDSAAATTDFYADNIAYMDKLVGKLIAELESLKLRENTLVIFVGDNGTAPPRADTSTVHGKRLSGQKGSMLEGGSRVPMMASWPGTVPAGKVLDDLMDFSDYMPTFAELTGAKLPAGVTIDGHSFAERLKGKAGNPREWLYVELNGKWYARDSRCKLTGTGELYDLKGAPFVEELVPVDKQDAKAAASKKRLQEVLDKLNPAAGKQGARGPGMGAKKRKNANRRNGGLGSLLKQ
jgi:arylsulfatase A